MMIDVRHIQHSEPHKVAFDLAQAVLNPKNHHQPNHVFDQPVTCHAVLHRSGQDIWVQASAQIQTSPCCDRCLEDFTQTIALQKTWLCVPMDLQQQDQDAELLDESIYSFHPPLLDLGEIFREQILLELPMQFLCNSSCQGLCGGCGVNLNIENHLDSCKKAPIFQQKVENM